MEVEWLLEKDPGDVIPDGSVSNGLMDLISNAEAIIAPFMGGLQPIKELTRCTGLQSSKAYSLKRFQGDGDASLNLCSTKSKALVSPSNEIVRIAVEPLPSL
jgi:hypothetical protein